MESQLIQVSLMLKVFMMRYWGYQRRATRGRNAETRGLKRRCSGFSQFTSPGQSYSVLL
jgi:hypothetical protein